MITSIYASLAVLLIVRLSISVIKLRRKYRISLGDGGNEELQVAIRAHANALEYIPITLLLLLMLELNGAPKILIHLLGLVLITGRIIHAIGLSGKDLPKRDIRNADNDLSVNWFGDTEFGVPAANCAIQTLVNSASGHEAFTQAKQFCSDCAVPKLRPGYSIKSFIP